MKVKIDFNVLHFLVVYGVIFGRLSGLLPWRLYIFTFLKLADYRPVEQIWFSHSHLKIKYLLSDSRSVAEE